MKKRLISLLTVCIIAAFPAAALAGEPDLESRLSALEARVAALEAIIGSDPSAGAPAAETESLQELPDISLDDGEHSIKYAGSELSKDYEGNDVVVVYFDYINGSADTSCAGFDFLIKAFQNKRQLEGTAMDDNQPCDDYYNEFQSGADTIRVGNAFLISDTSDVTVNIVSLMNPTADPVEFTVSP